MTLIKCATQHCPLMLRGMVVLALFLTTACAMLPSDYPETKSFYDPQKRDHSTIVVDQARCGAINGAVERDISDYYFACMDKKGYKFVTVSE